MGSQTLEILRQGVWASLTGGWFYDPHQGVFCNVVHLYLWLFLLCTPFVAYLYFPGTWLTWYIYCVVSSAIILLVKIGNMALHRLYDRAQTMSEANLKNQFFKVTKETNPIDIDTGIELKVMGADGSRNSVVQAINEASEENSMLSMENVNSILDLKVDVHRKNSSESIEFMFYTESILSGNSQQDQQSLAGSASVSKSLRSNTATLNNVNATIASTGGGTTDSTAGGGKFLMVYPEHEGELSGKHSASESGAAACCAALQAAAAAGHGRQMHHLVRKSSEKFKRRHQRRRLERQSSLDATVESSPNIILRLMRNQSDSQALVQPTMAATSTGTATRNETFLHPHTQRSTSATSSTNAAGGKSATAAAKAQSVALAALAQMATTGSGPSYAAQHTTNATQQQQQRLNTTTMTATGVTPLTTPTATAAAAEGGSSNSRSAATNRSLRLQRHRSSETHDERLKQQNRGLFLPIHHERHHHHHFHQQAPPSSSHRSTASSSGALAAIGGGSSILDGDEYDVDLGGSTGGVPGQTDQRTPRHLQTWILGSSSDVFIEDDSYTKSDFSIEQLDGRAAKQQPLGSSHYPHGRHYHSGSGSGCVHQLGRPSMRKDSNSTMSALQLPVEASRSGSVGPNGSGGGGGGGSGNGMKRRRHSNATVGLFKGGGAGAAGSGAGGGGGPGVGGGNTSGIHCITGQQSTVRRIKSTALEISCPRPSVSNLVPHPNSVEAINGQQIRNPQSALLPPPSKCLVRNAHLNLCPKFGGSFGGSSGSGSSLNFGAVASPSTATTTTTTTTTGENYSGSTTALIDAIAEQADEKAPSASSGEQVPRPRPCLGHVHEGATCMDDDEDDYAPRWSMSGTVRCPDRCSAESDVADILAGDDEDEEDDDGDDDDFKDFDVDMDHILNDLQQTHNQLDDDLLRVQHARHPRTDEALPPLAHAEEEACSQQRQQSGEAANNDEGGEEDDDLGDSPTASPSALRHRLHSTDSETENNNGSQSPLLSGKKWEVVQSNSSSAAPAGMAAARAAAADKAMRLEIADVQQRNGKKAAAAGASASVATVQAPPDVPKGEGDSGCPSSDCEQVSASSKDMLLVGLDETDRSAPPLHTLKASAAAGSEQWHTAGRAEDAEEGHGSCAATPTGVATTPANGKSLGAIPKVVKYREVDEMTNALTAAERAARSDPPTSSSHLHKRRGGSSSNNNNSNNNNERSLALTSDDSKTLTRNLSASALSQHSVSAEALAADIHKMLWIMHGGPVDERGQPVGPDGQPVPVNQNWVPPHRAATNFQFYEEALESLRTCTPPASAEDALAMSQRIYYDKLCRYSKQFADTTPPTTTATLTPADKVSAASTAALTPSMQQTPRTSRPGIGVVVSSSSSTGLNTVTATELSIQELISVINAERHLSQAHGSAGSGGSGSATLATTTGGGGGGGGIGSGAERSGTPAQWHARPATASTAAAILNVDGHHFDGYCDFWRPACMLSAEKPPVAKSFYKYRFKWCGCEREFKISMDRLELLALFDRDLHWLHVVISVLLCAMVSYLGATILQLGYYKDLFAFLFCAVIAGAQYSLVKSVQPDAASPIHGFNKIVAYSRAIYFSLCAGLLLSFDGLRQEYARQTEPQVWLFFGVSFAPSQLAELVTQLLSLLLLCFPLIFSLGLFPQINTFLMYLLEQVDMHGFGGNATGSLLGAFLCVVRSVMGVLLLYGPLYAALAEGRGTQYILFSIFCAMLIPLGYHLSRAASDFSHVWALIKNCIVSTYHDDDDDDDDDDEEGEDEAGHVINDEENGGERNQNAEEDIVNQLGSSAAEGLAPQTSLDLEALSVGSLSITESHKIIKRSAVKQQAHNQRVLRSQSEQRSTSERHKVDTSGKAASATVSAENIEMCSLDKLPQASDATGAVGVAAPLTPQKQLEAVSLQGKRSKSKASSLGASSSTQTLAKAANGEKNGRKATSCASMMTTLSGVEVGETTTDDAADLATALGSEGQLAGATEAPANSSTVEEDGQLPEGSTFDQDDGVLVTSPAEGEEKASLSSTTQAADLTSTMTAAVSGQAIDEAEVTAAAATAAKKTRKRSRKLAQRRHHRRNNSQQHFENTQQPARSSSGQTHQPTHSSRISPGFGPAMCPSGGSTLTGGDTPDPLPKKLQQTVNTRLKNDLVVTTLLAVIVLGLHSSTVFTVLQPDLNVVLYAFTGALGLLLHYIIPQMRKHMPWLCFARPLLRQREHGQFEVAHAPKVMWFEKVYIYLCMVERNVLFPLLVISASTADAAVVGAKYGLAWGTLIVSVCALKFVRNAYSDPTNQYLIVLFTVLLFRADFAVASETFLVDYFFVSLAYRKCCDFLLKLQFIVTYIAPWQITWGSAFHAFAQPFSVPHSAMLFLQAAISALLSTPLNPFLGSAIFLTSYVRPIKFWERDYNTRRIDHSNTRLSSQLERDLGADDNNLNSIFYEHLTRSLQHSLCGDLLMGRWGNVNQGDCFVLASDYLNCLVHIIELGNGLCTFQMRGLEFRGTYCQQREVEAITEDVEDNDGCCCCDPGHLPRVLSANAMFSTRWLAWQVVAAQYVLEGYSISDNLASATLQVFEYRKMLITYYIKSIIFYVVRNPKLEQWLASGPIQDALQHTLSRQFVDLDAIFNYNLDEDFDFRAMGITRSSFCYVYLSWINFCCDKRKESQQQQQQQQQQHPHAPSSAHSAAQQPQMGASAGATAAATTYNDSKSTPNLSLNATSTTANNNNNNNATITPNASALPAAAHNNSAQAKSQSQQQLRMRPQKSATMSGTGGVINLSNLSSEHIATSHSFASISRQTSESAPGLSGVGVSNLGAFHGPTIAGEGQPGNTGSGSTGGATPTLKIPLGELRRALNNKSLPLRPGGKEDSPTTAGGNMLGRETSEPQSAGGTATINTTPAGATTTTATGNNNREKITIKLRVLTVAKDSPLVSLCLALGLLARRSLATASHSSLTGVEFFLHGLHALFKGDFRITSPRDEWVFADMELLHSVVAPAVKMALKLQQDHISNPDEFLDPHALYEAIDTSSKDLVISHEADPVWRSAVLRGAPNLLALRHVMEDGSDEYRIIRLTKRCLSFRVIKLNRECVRGLWAGQQQELIYLRNRNPERGSIQNAKQALRNIINSSCDQPIGYPIYVSPLTTSYADTNEQLRQVIGGAITLESIRSTVLDWWHRVRERCRQGCSSGSALEGNNMAANMGSGGGGLTGNVVLIGPGGGGGGGVGGGSAGGVLMGLSAAGSGCVAGVTAESGGDIAIYGPLTVGNFFGLRQAGNAGHNMGVAPAGGGGGLVAANAAVVGGSASGGLAMMPLAKPISSGTLFAGLLSREREQQDREMLRELRSVAEAGVGLRKSQTHSSCGRSGGGGDRERRATLPIASTSMGVVSGASGGGGVGVGINAISADAAQLLQTDFAEGTAASSSAAGGGGGGASTAHVGVSLSHTCCSSSSSCGLSIGGGGEITQPKTRYAKFGPNLGIGNIITTPGDYPRKSKGPICLTAAAAALAGGNASDSSGEAPPPTRQRIIRLYTHAVITDASEIYDCLDLGRLPDVVWPCEEMRLKGGRQAWRDWSPSVGMTGVVVHYWQPEHLLATHRSHVNCIIYLLEIGEYLVPVGEYGVSECTVLDANGTAVVASADRCFNKTLARLELEAFTGSQDGHPQYHLHYQQAQQEQQQQQQQYHRQHHYHQPREGLTPILGSSLESPTSQLAGASEGFLFPPSHGAASPADQAGSGGGGYAPSNRSKLKMQAVSSSSSSDGLDDVELNNIQLQRSMLLKIWTLFAEKNQLQEQQQQQQQQHFAVEEEEDEVEPCREQQDPEAGVLVSEEEQPKELLSGASGNGSPQSPAISPVECNDEQAVAPATPTAAAPLPATPPPPAVVLSQPATPTESMTAGSEATTPADDVTINTTTTTDLDANDV